MGLSPSPIATYLVTSSPPGRAHERGRPSLGPGHRRNVVVFADGEVDRSPTGSATSARTALLADDGSLEDGTSWRNDSIIGTSFRARVVGRVASGVITEVEGTAFRSGEHRFILDPRDELGTGFVLG